MAEAVSLTVAVREQAGTGPARATRRAGRVPAIIYGNKQSPQMISLDPRELDRQLRQTGFFSRIFEFSVNGSSERVLARDVQFHPVSDRPLHVDFLRFGADTMIAVEVQVVFEGEEECPGIRRDGVLNIVRHTVELLCKADSIPSFITVNLEGLDIGDSVHISDITLPVGVEPTITDRDFTIATIAAPTVVVEEEEEEGEEEEGIEGVEGEEAAEGEGDTEESGGEES